MASDDPTRRLVMQTMARAGVDTEAAPGQRLRPANREILSNEVEDLMGTLRPLSVGVDENGDDGVVEIIGRLGEGGMGIVELAVQRALGREVALKRMIKPPKTAREGYPLLDEARILGGLEHPNIVPVHAVGMDPELGPVVLLKRVQGVSWAEEISDDHDHLPHEPRTLEKHLRILMQVCNALHFAHSRGIIHRDIKPDNVMLGAYGEVYLLDWGLALDKNSEHVGQPVIAGTASYMAPEMVAGKVERIDARTDVYLLGATLHQVLTGEPRHAGKTVLTCVTRAALSKPAKYGPDVPSDLAAICNAACAKERKARFPTAEHMHRAVADFIDRREAHQLLDAARTALEKADEDPKRTTRRLYEARFAAEEALRTNPDMAEAKRIRARCLHAAIRNQLERDNLQTALEFIDELDTKLPGPLAELLAAKERAADDELARVSQLERDADPEYSRVQRLRFGMVGFVALAIYHGTLYGLFPPGDGPLTPLTMFIGGIALVVPLTVPLIFASAKLRETAIGRQFGWILVACLTGVLAARGIGLIGDLQMSTIYAFECALVAMVPLAVDVPLRGRVPASLVGIATAALCVTRPEWARHIHVTWHMGMMVLVLVDNSIPAKRIAPD